MSYFLADVETHPPSGVDFCIECHFFKMSERNLVVVRRNELEVFRLGSGDGGGGGGGAAKKLESEIVYRLHGNVESIEACRLLGDARESLF